MDTEDLADWQRDLFRQNTTYLAKNPTAALPKLLPVWKEPRWVRIALLKAELKMLQALPSETAPARREGGMSKRAQHRYAQLEIRVKRTQEENRVFDRLEHAAKEATRIAKLLTQAAPARREGTE